VDLREDRLLQVADLDIRNVRLRDHHDVEAARLPGDRVPVADAVGDELAREARVVLGSSKVPTSTKAHAPMCLGTAFDLGRSKPL